MSIPFGLYKAIDLDTGIVYMATITLSYNSVTTINPNSDNDVPMLETREFPTAKDAILFIQQQTGENEIVRLS